MEGRKESQKKKGKEMDRKKEEEMNKEITKEGKEKREQQRKFGLIFLSHFLPPGFRKGSNSPAVVTVLQSSLFPVI